MKSSKPIYAIVGPTASGKTELGVELALRLGNGEVINCDSVQIYDQIQIATAKPCEEEMRGVPHHLIGYVAPEIKYTAADWAEDATEKIREIEARNGTPILVGGTGFYLRSLRNPLFESPKTDLKLRARLKNILEKKGAPHLYKILQRIDPSSATTIYPNDFVRTMRAIEVRLQTGKPISELQPTRAEPPEFANRIQVFALRPDRQELYDKINMRTEHHFANGLIDEVINLRAGGLQDDTNALGAHAYRRVCEYLRNERSLESAIEESKKNVRNYAKRQLTWFKKEPGIRWLEGFGNDPEIQKILFRNIE